MRVVGGLCVLGLDGVGGGGEERRAKEKRKEGKKAKCPRLWDRTP